MLVALFVLALLSVMGATTLNLAGVDYQIAIRNRRHMFEAWGERESPEQ